MSEHTQSGVVISGHTRVECNHCGFDAYFPNESGGVTSTEAINAALDHGGNCSPEKQVTSLGVVACPDCNPRVPKGAFS